jgi:ParB family transcriptional regulator, chromosome partitioning protein
MALGKSLNNILEDYFGNEEAITPENNFEVKKINIEDVIIGPYQTRKEFDPESIRALSESIVQTGLIAPILVHVNDEGKFVLLAGERRLRASKLANLSTIEAKIVSGDSISEEKKVFLTAYENLLREDLNPIELARTYELLIVKNKLSIDMLSKNLGKSDQYVRNFLKLLDLSPQVQTLLESKKLTEGQARHLQGLTPKDQEAKAIEIIESGVSVRALEKEKRNYHRRATTGIEDEDDSFILEHPIFQDIKNFKTKFPNTTIDFKGNLRKGKLIINFEK